MPDDVSRSDRSYNSATGEYRLSPDQIRRIGVVLFGPDHWQAGMTHALGLADSKRVRQWISSNPRQRRRPSAGVSAELLAMLRQKSVQAAALADEIERGARDTMDQLIEDDGSVDIEGTDDATTANPDP